MPASMTRRQFTQRTAAAAIATTAASYARAAGANERIRLGFIGLGNRGDQVLDAFLAHKDQEVVAICDLYQPYLDFAANKIGTNPAQTKEYRKVLERKDVDAVVICTPDHWHAIQMIEACRAGKDVYVEKPLSLCVAEGRAMVRAARETKRVTQCGIHRRSVPTCQEAAAFIREGGIGALTAIRAFHVMNEWPKGIGRPADGEPPAELDWDAWSGPAPLHKYNPNRAFYRFRWFYDYSGGQVTNFGVHYMDMAHAAMGQDAPLSVVAMGGKFADYDNREVPDTLEAMWTYPRADGGRTLVTFTQFNSSGAGGAARPCEMEFRGTKGTLYMSGGNYEVAPEVIGQYEVPARSPLNRELDKQYRQGAKAQIEPKAVKGSQETTFHARNFLDNVKSRGTCTCDVEIGHRSTTAPLIANIAHRTQALLAWDAKGERFTNNEGANGMLRYAYREPYAFPG
jgi:predicted dehydrogenase